MLGGKLVREFLADSGASYCCIGFGDLSKKERKRMCPLEQIFSICTANGTVTVEKFVPIWVEPLRLTLNFVAMPEPPALISLGRLARVRLFMEIR